MSESASENVIAFNRARGPRRPRRTPRIPAGTPLSALLESWELALTASNKAANTLKCYIRTARAFIAYLDEHDLPCDAEGVTVNHVRAFLVAEQARTSVHTSAAHHAYLGVWFRWMADEGERTGDSPVIRADKPKVPRKVREFLTDEDLVALLEACDGPAFLDRRDTAILRVLIDNGMRVSGLTGLGLKDVDLRQKRLRIVLKGGSEHWAPIGDKTRAALDRYIRIRSRHPLAELPDLWLGQRGRALTQGGVAEMLARRGEQTGVAHLHPHRFRGTAAHNLLAAGANLDDVQSILGWRDPAMVRVYAGDLVAERARATHARLSPSDRI